MIQCAPFGRASTSRSLEEAALDDEWPGPPDKEYTQLSILDFARRPLKPKSGRRTRQQKAADGQNSSVKNTAPPKESRANQTSQKRRADRPVRVPLSPSLAPAPAPRPEHGERKKPRRPER